MTINIREVMKELLPITAHKLIAFCLVNNKWQGRHKGWCIGDFPLQNYRVMMDEEQDDLILQHWANVIVGSLALLFLTIIVNLVQFHDNMNICKKMQKVKENVHTPAPFSIMLITDRQIWYVGVQHISSKLPFYIIFG